MLINADNFHALQLLLYAYEGKVDVIYIDPPYNTGARDWKYNNDYVDANDLVATQQMAFDDAKAAQAGKAAPESDRFRANRHNRRRRKYQRLGVACLNRYFQKARCRWSVR